MMQVINKPDKALEQDVQLYSLAHARSGDKGNHSNIAIFAYRPELYEILAAQVTPERVTELFASRKPTSVKRYLLPNLHGMNFVLENVLDGGVNESLNLDMHGKALSFLLLFLKLSIPLALLEFMDSTIVLSNTAEVSRLPLQQVGSA